MGLERDGLITSSWSDALSEQTQHVSSVDVDARTNSRSRHAKCDTAQATVLVVEAGLRWAIRIRRGLEQEGFLVLTTADGHEGLRQARVGSFAAIMLGTALPGLDGYEVLHMLRARSLWTPLIMLADEHDEVAQVDALNFGADDYLIKPFSVDVLVARLRALLRRGAVGQPIALVAGSLCLDSVRRRVTRGPTVIKLTSREFGVLEYLMRHRDTVVTKAELRQNVWEPRYHDAVNLVEVYIGYLRRKIDAPFGTVTIRTIRGVGYRIDSV